LTLVITACFKFMAFTAWATRSGSSQSRGFGWPRLMSQKPQVRVQTSPISRKVAVPAPQHSPIFGHMAITCRVKRAAHQALQPFVRLAAGRLNPFRAAAARGIDFFRVNPVSSWRMRH
jgi:hypothetical protein